MTSQKINMNRNSYDFSLAETSSLAQVDPDQNPSWINLKSLKDIIHQSTTERGSINNNNSKSNSNYNSRSLLPPQINSANNKANKNAFLRSSNNNLCQGNKENQSKNGKSLINSKKNNSKGSSSSRQLYNPSELLNFDSQNPNDSDYNTFTTLDQNEISNLNAQAILNRLSSQIEPIDTHLNYFSNDDSQSQQQLQTLVMNHIDTPQSIMIPDIQGHEIESILKDEIIARLINSDESNSTPNILTSLHHDAMYESQASLYGKTQEFDISNFNNNSEECLNYIQSLTQQDDNKTEIGQITHRVQQNSNLIIGSDDNISHNSQLDSHNRSLSGNNLFKRQKNQPSQARESIGRQSIDIKQISINLDKQNMKNVSNNVKESTKGQIIQHVKKTSQLIDLTKRSFDNFQPQKSVVINLFEDQDDKENQNPYQTHAGSTSIQQKLEDYQQNQKLRIVDKEFDQFCNEIEKMRQQNVPALTLTNSNEVSFKRNNQMKSLDRINTQTNQQDTPQKLTSHQSFELSESRSIRSPESNSTHINLLTNQNNSQTQDNIQQQSPAPQINTTLQQSFKRSRPNRQLKFVKQNDTNNTNSLVLNQQQQQQHTQFDVSQIEQQSSLDMSLQSMQQNIIQEELQQIQQKQRLELITMKKENIKLQRQLDQQQKDHTLELEQVKLSLQQQESQKLKDQEDEYQIIIEGLKQEYEDKMSEMQQKYLLKIEELNEEHQREILHKNTKIENKREKLYKIRDQFDEKRKEYNAAIIELEAYKSKVEEMTQYQLQNGVDKEITENRDSVGNLFMTSQSCDNLRMLNSNQNPSYFSQKDDSDTDNNLDHLHPFRNSDHKQPTPYQSFDNFLDLKKRTNADNQLLDIPNIIKNLQTSNNVYNSNSSNNSNGLKNLKANNINQHNISTDPYNQHMHYYFSLSQVQQQQQQHQEDSAMNFSFSEVKTSFDNKSSCFYGDSNNNIKHPLATNSSGSKDNLNLLVAPHNNNNKISLDNNNNDDINIRERQLHKKFSILDTIDQNSDEDDETQRNDQNMNNINDNLEEDHQKTNSIPQYESDSDNNNDIKKYLDSSSVAQTDSHKTASLSINNTNQLLHQRNPSDSHQHSSRLDHLDIEPQTENYIDDDEDDDLDDDQEEESKSNLSYKIDDMTTTSNNNNNTNRSNQINLVNNNDKLKQQKQQNIIYDNDDDDMEGMAVQSKQCGLIEGSENAPEDSGFLSDDGDQERIVNESSLYNEEDFNQSQNLLACTVSADPYLLYSDAFEEQDPYLIMTGRSESAMDDDDNEVEGISKCKAINSSYINLKRNNLLIGYGRR